MARSLIEMLSDDRVHVIDGAMGTMLYSRGVFVNVCYDELNLSDPETIRDVHEAYVRAGAEVIETNTFGANPIKLSSHGLDARTEEINARAVEIARRAANGQAQVLGAIGPLGIRIEPWGPTAREEAEAYFTRQARGLHDGGVDGFILETFSDLEEIIAAFRAVRAVSDRPVFAQMSVDQDGTTSYGTSIETIVMALHTAGVQAVGVNCSVGPAAMLDTIERMADTTGLPISAQPNAGLPRAVGDRKIYLASPEYMAQYARRMIDAGARFVGGCCGTTPQHIKHISDYIKSVQPRTSSAMLVVDSPLPTSAAEPVPLAERSRLGQRLAGGEPIWTVEIMPPRGWDTTELVADAHRLAEAGVHAIHVVDSARAHGRMGALHTALIIERDAGIETVVHYTCRDRNMLGMVNDLLGAAATGLRNILIVTGDPPATGPYPDSTAVFDIDSIGLTNVIHRMNRGLDPGGNSFGEPTQYVIGVSVNQSAVDPAKEWERFRWKVDAGAEFAVTQPVFDPDGLLHFLDREGSSGFPILASLWPLTSLRAAEYLANEIPGVSVPEEVTERMRRAQDSGAESAWAEGITIAREIYDAVRDRVQGIQIIAPFGRVDAALRVLEAVPNAPTP